MTQEINNPFRPGAGHYPPYLAGREVETEVFQALLHQTIILDNLVLTGLRGVGKTVLTESFRPLAVDQGWLWAGADFSESTSVNENFLATRILTDLAVVTSSIVTGVTKGRQSVGFVGESPTITHKLDYPALLRIWSDTPGLTVDKLKRVLEITWEYIQPRGAKGIIFAYDEAHNLSDRAEKEEYPLSLLLDVFQSIQRKEIPFMLLLTGLPTLMPKLVAARTFAERMFRVVFLDSLTRDETEAAIKVPIERSKCPVTFQEDAFDIIFGVTHGYPYFVQHVCREAYDVWVRAAKADLPPEPIPIMDIMRKLDSDFYAGRWAKATDRQRSVLALVAHLPNREQGFSAQDIVEASKASQKPLSNSRTNQLLSSLCDAGLVYKHGWGRYSFAVPLLDQFINRDGIALVTRNSNVAALPANQSDVERWVA